MVDIKTDGNAHEAFDQDQMVNISCLIHNACDVAKSRQSIEDPTDAT